jgi:hypothetical protein
MPQLARECAARYAAQGSSQVREAGAIGGARGLPNQYFYLYGPAPTAG